MRWCQMTWVVLLCLFLLPLSATAQSGLLKSANKSYELHDYKEAIKSYLRYINRNRNSVEARARLADSYRHLNQLSDAAKWYKEVVYNHEINPIHLFEYGLTLKGLGNYSEARNWFLSYAESNPEVGMHYAASCTHALEKQNTPAAYKINAEFTNTDAADFGPAFFKDRLVFASSRVDYNENKRTRDNVNLPFITSRDQNNYLRTPQLLHQRLKNGNEGPVSYSADGRWVAITRNNFVNSIRQIPSSGLNLNIQIAEVLPNGEWQNEKFFPFNGSNFATGYPSFSSDGNTLYFASNRPDGFGGFDIFVTYRIGDTWTTPENLGPTVNTQGDEISPFFDGTDLYFSSNWHKGMGGMDVFRTSKTGSSWDRIYHLDTQINSPRDDYGFIYDKDKNIGYLVSNRLGGKGNEDIYRISKASNNIEIIVLDELSMQPISDAAIDFSSCGQPTFMTNVSGRHVLQVPDGLNCQAIVRKSGYISSILNVSQNQMAGVQSLQVLLKRSGSTTGTGNMSGSFVGNVYNVNTGQNVPSVLIRATSQQTGQSLEAVSDESGNYFLALQPYNTYTINYSKAGFLDISRSINVGNGQETNLLGSFPLRYSGVEPPEEPQVNYGSGYSVQVAAFASSRTNDMSKFQSLGSIGNVYNRYEGDKTKVRIGVFGTKAAATTAVKRARQHGFKDAFVVSESLEGLGQEVLIADNTTIPKGNNGSGSGYSAYKVRLAAYKKPQFFQRAKVENFGIVEERIKGPWTIMLLAGYSNLGEAQRAVGNAIRAGFPQAHVVIDNGVKLTKVK